MGRLSNPPEHLKDLVDKGAHRAEQGLKRRSRVAQPGVTAAMRMASEEAGRLSNPSPRPVQRRLGSAEVERLATGYQTGRSLRLVAADLGMHHATVAAHLEQLGMRRRPNERKMSASDALEASQQYAAGDSLATVAAFFGVDATTVRREPHRMGVAIRVRRGWAQ